MIELLRNRTGLGISVLGSCGIVEKKEKCEKNGDRSERRS